MCRDEFNNAVRPNVREFPIGKRGVGFDRVELDAWADAYIAANAIEKTSTNLHVNASAGGRCTTNIAKAAWSDQ
jgi:hypothetical protein